LVPILSGTVVVQTLTWSDDSAPRGEAAWRAQKMSAVEGCDAGLQNYIRPFREVHHAIVNQRRNRGSQGAAADCGKTRRCSP